jgi:hypothetical protein
MYLANTKYILAGHEGEPASPQQRRPPPPSNASAPLTYNRRFPRPGDSADPVPQQSARAQPNENLRKMTYDGCSTTYDTRHIQN